MYYTSEKVSIRTWLRCTKRSCAGRSSGEAAFMCAASAASSSGSRSTARSQTASWPSADDVASIVASAGHHSTDVTGPLRAYKNSPQPICRV